MIEVNLPDSRQLENDLGIVRSRLLADLKETITKAAIDLSAHIKDQKLSGQVLNRRTGRLSRSINYQVADTDGGVEATVGTNVEYARIHEYGFKGTVNVKEHMRRMANGVKAVVRSHSRRVDLPERSFLRSSLEDMRADIDERIARVIGQSIASSGQGAA